MLGSQIVIGSHWIKRSCKSPKISRTRHATSGASKSRLSRARGSSGWCMTPRLPVHKRNRVRTSLKVSGFKVSWSSNATHALVGTSIRWLRWRNVSLARALNEGSAELCMGSILECQPLASPDLFQCAVFMPGLRLRQFSSGRNKNKMSYYRGEASDELATMICGGEVQEACGWYPQIAVLSRVVCGGAAGLRLVTAVASCMFA